jgi:two-component system response regulator YesN
MKLVIVDDHRILLEGIRALLNNTHEVVNVFTDPLRAEIFLRDHPVDVLITDYQMPGLNGIELFRKARLHQPL